MLAIKNMVSSGSVIRMNGLGRRIVFAAISVALVIFALPVSGQSLILTAQENRSLGNYTLHIVDVDTQTAKVWLEISDPGGFMLSEILSVNETLSWKNQTLTLSGIYAGEASDLVFLRISSSD